MEELQVEDEDGGVRQDVGQQQHGVVDVGVVQERVEGQAVEEQKHEQEEDPVEALALDLLVVLLPELKLRVRLRKAEQDLGERPNPWLFKCH